jgi:tetratricopeptide (TPR) repeat protein
MSDSWTARIADRYRCTLSKELADWFDGEIWKQVGGSEYHAPIDPELLLTAAPEAIWPGLMTCDLLPLIGNTAGDWLCVRVDQNNVAAEIVQWYHGGGDWIPWGNNLAEALVFDSLIDRLPGQSRRHAIPAEDPRPRGDANDPATDPILGWALQYLPPSVAVAFDAATHESEVGQLLLDAKVAEIAVRCELVLSALMRPERNFEQLLRADPSLSRIELEEWSFDTERIPDHKRSLLQQLGASLVGRQDWNAAADLAEPITRLAPELAWAWDIVGYAAERRGDLELAKSCYRNAAQCSVFTDQSVRLETHWATDQSAKFSVSRLLLLSPDEVGQSTYLSLLCDPDTNRRGPETTAYWIEQGSRFAAAEGFHQAYRCFMAAAWDVGAKPITAYGELLERIAEMAHSSDQPARAEIARTHRRCLRDRYGC